MPVCAFSKHSSSAARLKYKFPKLRSYKEGCASVPSDRPYYMIEIAPLGVPYMPPGRCQRIGNGRAANGTGSGFDHRALVLVFFLRLSLFWVWVWLFRKPVHTPLFWPAMLEVRAQSRGGGATGTRRYKHSRQLYGRPAGLS